MDKKDRGMTGHGRPNLLGASQETVHPWRAAKIECLVFQPAANTKGWLPTLRNAKLAAGNTATAR